MNWNFVTASFGENRFHESAERLISQAKKMGVFSDFFLVTEQNLDLFAPRISQKYGNFLNSSCKGYGFYSWKSEIVYSILNNKLGDGVMYVDAGCELNSRFLARMRLRFMMNKAEEIGFFHVLKYRELEYTKRRVLDYFSLSPSDSSSWQIQATWFLLSSKGGIDVARKWTEACLTDIQILDDSLGEEQDEFIEHRYDQSVFSCLLKSMGVSPNKHNPCFRPVSLKSKIRCYLHPVWSARNRSGVSIQ